MDEGSFKGGRRELAAIETVSSRAFPYSTGGLDFQYDDVRARDGTTLGP